MFVLQIIGGLLVAKFWQQIFFCHHHLVYSYMIYNNINNIYTVLCLYTWDKKWLLYENTYQMILLNFTFFFFIQANHFRLLFIVVIFLWHEINCDFFIFILLDMDRLIIHVCKLANFQYVFIMVFIRFHKFCV